MKVLNRNLAVFAVVTVAVVLIPATVAAQGVLYVQDNKVGIGTATPLVPLHVVKTTAGNANMFRVDNAGAASFEFRNTAYPAYWFFQADQDGTFKFSKLGTGGAEVVVRNRLDAFGATMFVDGSIEATNVAFTSSRTKKTGFTGIDRGEILSKVMQLPIESWHYVTEDSNIRHVGPTSEDFAAAFGLGVNDKRISMVDAYGVTFAAIQALHDEVSERDGRIAELEREVSELKALVSGLVR